MKDPFDPFDATTLKQSRVARGLTLAALAKLADVEPSTIMRIERGKTPTLDTWNAIRGAMSKAPVTSSTPRNPPAA